jgi:hypothetical protein
MVRASWHFVFVRLSRIENRHNLTSDPSHTHTGGADARAVGGGDGRAAAGGRDQELYGNGHGGAARGLGCVTCVGWCFVWMLLVYVCVPIPI